MGSLRISLVDGCNQSQKYPQGESSKTPCTSLFGILVRCTGNRANYCHDTWHNELVCHHTDSSVEPLVIADPQAPTSQLMDPESVTKRIALEIGPKWTQLYSRLGLSPRDVWQIVSGHTNECTKTRWQNCALDCIQMWRKTVQHLDEMEAIRELLNTLRKIQGCVHLAEELSRINGEQFS